MLVWRNGRRKGLKIPRSQGRAGSSPATSTKKTGSFETAFLFYLDIFKREKILYDNIYFAIIFLILLRKQNKFQVLKGTYAKSLP